MKVRLRKSMIKRLEDCRNIIYGSIESDCVMNAAAPSPAFILADILPVFEPGTTNHELRTTNPEP